MTGSEPSFAPLPAGRAWFVREDGEAAERAGRIAAPGLRVTGADRTAFLTRILSGDLPKPPGAAPTALLGPKGNLVAAATATALADRVFLDCEPARLAALRDGLDRYRIADAVEITDDRGGDWFCVFGERAAEVLATVTAFDHTELTALAPGGVSPAAEGSGFVRRDFRPWPSFTARLPSDRAEIARRGFEESGAAEASPDEAAYLRLASGEPRWGAELSETSLPLAAGLAAHVRLGKGCYIGQEYVARQAHRGRVPRLLRQLRFAESDPPPPGAPIRFDGASVAEITSSAPRPAAWEGDGPSLALATLPAEIPPGATVSCADAEASVHPLP